MTESFEPVRLQAHQGRRAAAVLGRAFHNDPFMKYLVPDDARRARLLPSLYSVLVRYCLAYGEGYTTPVLDGVACWLPPGETSPPFLRLARVGLRGAPVGLGFAGLWRFLRVARYMEEIHAHYAPGTHWYLWGLGVEPARQGQGIGGLLMGPVLARATAEDIPCYLGVNVPFYQRHGFHVVSEGEAPGSGLRAWAMLR